MARRAQHREPIIDAAVTLFRRQGYAGTGLNDIVDASGAPKGSLYHYFPGGKRSIAVAAVEQAGVRLNGTLNALANESATTSELLGALAAMLAKWLRQSDYRDGCPMTTVLLELAPQEREVARAGRDAFRARTAILRKKLLEDGLPFTQAEALAQLATSALQGALVQARVERSDRPVLHAAKELGFMIDARRRR